MTIDPVPPVRLSFSKGHGTENDFVVIFDPGGVIELSADQVRFLCDRHAGIGADGVLRITRCSSLADGAPYAEQAEWFMDYRNADGSTAEMCGNGVRVFAQYLRGELHLDGSPLAVGSRGGVKWTTYEPDGTISVDMGPAKDLGRSSVLVAGVELGGQAVSMGNPHLVCFLDGTELQLDDLDLTLVPAFDADFFRSGVNVEFVQAAAETPTGYDAHVFMRVFERGVGETRSCGTGICAVAHSVLAARGASAGRVLVDVPGGRLSTTVSADSVVLRGPAIILASGTVTLPNTLPSTPSG